MVRFSKLILDATNKLIETEIRMIDRSVIAKCPNLIFVAEHYRDDGTCKCNDHNETIMEKWGYRWDDGKKGWV